MNTTLLKGSEVAKILNISKAMAYRMISEGKLPSVRFQRTVRIKPEDLDAFIQANTCGKSVADPAQVPMITTE